MATDRVSEYGESTGEQTTTSTSFVDRQTLTFTPDDNSDYIFFASCLTKNSATTQQGDNRFLHYTDTVEAFLHTVEANDTSDYYTACGMLKETYGASPGSKNFKWQSRTEVSSTVSIKEMRIAALKLVAADEYAESLGESTSMSDTPVTKVTLTFTPATTGDYLIIYSAQTQIATVSSGVEVILTHSGTDYGLSQQEAKDSTDYFAHMGMVKLNLANSSQTFILTFRRNVASGTAGIKNARVVALRLDEFHSTSDATQRTQQNTTSATYVDALSHTFTPKAEQYFSFYNAQGGSNSTSVSNLIQARNGGSAVQGEWTKAMENVVDETTFFFIKRETLSASSTIFDIQHKSEDGIVQSETDELAVAFLQLLSTGQTAGMVNTVGGMTTKFSRGVYYKYPGQQLLRWRHALPGAAPSNEEIEQARSNMRFVFSRVFGRVN